MGRGVITIVGFALIGTVAAGCSGSSTNKARAPKTTTSVESAESEQWVAAAREGLMTSTDEPPNMTSADATCWARALVDTITVAKLKAAGVTLSGLRASDSDLPAALSRSLPPATKLALGGAFQSCGLGRFVGPLLASSIADASVPGFKLSPQSTKCVSDAFDSPAYRLFVGELVVSSGDNLNAKASSDFAVLLTRCLDWAAIFSAYAKVPFSAVESACINRVVADDPAFQDGLASEIRGKPSSNPGALFGAPLLTCLTPAHLSQLKPVQETAARVR